MGTACRDLGRAGVSVESSEEEEEEVGGDVVENVVVDVSGFCIFFAVVSLCHNAERPVVLLMRRSLLGSGRAREEGRQSRTSAEENKRQKRNQRWDSGRQTRTNKRDSENGRRKSDWRTQKGNKKIRCFVWLF